MFTHEIKGDKCRKTVAVARDAQRALSRTNGLVLRAVGVGNGRGCRRLARTLDDRAGARGDTGPEVGALFADGAGDLRALHLALFVDNDAGIVLEVDEHALFSAPRLALPNDDGIQHLLAQLWLALLDGAHEHVAHARRRRAVQHTNDALDRNHEQVLRAGVVGAVDQRLNVQTERHLEGKTKC
jgi:hypothetical protein